MTHSATITGQRDGKDFTEMHRSMHVWVKRKGHWQVVATRATPMGAPAQVAAQP